MSHAPKNTLFFNRLTVYLAQARFLTFSAFLHVVLVILGGSAILFEQNIKPPDFLAGDGTFLSTEVTTDLPPEPLQTPVDPVQIQPAASQMPTPAVVNAVTSLNTAPNSFQLPNATLARPDGVMSDGVGNAIKGLTNKLAGLGSGGIKGGTSMFFGRKEKTVSALVGSFYDMKQTRGRKETRMTVEEYGAVMSRFVKEGWRESILRDYFKAPHPLYATHVFIPDMSANEGPKAYGLEKEVQPSRWLVHYQGKVSPLQDGTVRFVGAGDDYLVVRFNGKVVLDHGFSKATDWQPERYYDYGWTSVPKGFARGDKIRVKAGQFYDMEILIGERPGGKVFFCLMLEDQDMEYHQDPKGNPILPVFRLTDEPLPEVTTEQTFPPYEPEGPIWKAAAKAGR
ncbi:MAG: hypothetical protein V4710_20265 [Verrucomicrobiota bacterium]